MPIAPIAPHQPVPPSGPAMPASRDRLDLVARVVGAARSELCLRRELSVRAVARRAGVDPGQVVRHVGTRSELLRRVYFEMAVDALQVIGSTSPVSATASCRDRLLAHAHGVRHWAQTSPQDMALILGPTSKPLMDEDRAPQGVAWFYAPLVDLLRDGHARGQLDPASARSGARLQPSVKPALLAAAGDLDPALVPAFVVVNTGIHGFLALEACGQLGAVYADLDHAYDAHVRALADAAGIR